MGFELRDYQKECIEAIEKAHSGSHLIVLPTGGGKTVIFSHIPRKGRVLILSHRDELVHQPIKYYDCPCGIEKAEETSHGEEVVSASVQSLVRRLNRFKPDEFDMIITDEAHHATAATYRKIYDYFTPRIHLGFTATPDRADKKDLHEIFNDIIFYRDLKWGINKGYLCDVECMQVDIGYDLSKARKVGNDYNAGDIEAAIDQDGFNDKVADVYNMYAKGQTLIFASTVKHAQAIANRIPGSMVVTANTPDRNQIIQDFTDRKIKCLVNVMVFTEGTDMPLIETIIMVRPTSNQSLYTQMAGRGLRLYPGKTHLRLIDCVGVSGKLGLRTACDLFGIDAGKVPKKKLPKLNGCMLSQMEDEVTKLIDGPDAWTMNASLVQAFAEENDLDMRNIAWRIMPDDSLSCSIGHNVSLYIPTPNALNQSDLLLLHNGYMEPLWENMDLQVLLNNAYAYLMSECKGTKKLWDVTSQNYWSWSPASDQQLILIYKLMKEQRRDLNEIPRNPTKGQASLIIDRLLYEKQKEKAS